MIFVFSWAALADASIGSQAMQYPTVRAKITGKDKSGLIFDTTNIPKVTADITKVDNIRGDDGKFYYRFKLKYSDKTISYGYIAVGKLELWYADLNNIVGSVLEFIPGDAPTAELAKSGCSVVNPKVIY